MANTKASLIEQNTQTYPSNTSGSITALSVKSFNNNFINAVATLGDTNVFTQPQTFGDVVQVNSNVIANNFVGPLIGTASWALNALTASYAVSASINTGSLVNTSSFNAYTASTNTFTSSIKTQVDALQAATSSYITNAQTSSMSVLSASYALNANSALTATSASYASSSTSASVANSATSASYALNATSASYATNANSALIATSASYASSSTSASFAISASWAPDTTNTGSLLTTASVSLNTITFTKGDASTFNITVNTGSAGGMNLGANVFTGSQTLSSSTIPASLIFNVSGALPSFVTESNGANLGYGNILFNQRTNATLSGSSIISGSGNIIFEAGAATTALKGVNGNNNIGQAILYNGALPTSTGNYAQSAIVSSGSRNTVSLNIALGQPTLNNNNNVSASFSTNVVVSPVQVNTAFSSSGLNASSTVQNGFFGTTLVDIAGSGSTARAFQNNLFGGNANTASLTTVAAFSNQSGSLYNTFVYGVGLIVSGTQIPTQTLHGGAFVGRYNETGSGLSDNNVVFAVGAGTSATRKTSLIVSASGDTLIRYGGQVSGSFRGQVSALTVASNTASLNLSTNNFFTLQLVSGSNVFINPSNILPGQTVNLLVNTTGSGTVSFPSTVKQASGSAYVPTTTTGVDVITFIAFDSTNLYISNVKNLI